MAVVLPTSKHRVEDVRPTRLMMSRMRAANLRLVRNTGLLIHD